MRESEAWAYVRTLVLAALLGAPVAFAAVLFETAIHDVIHLVWDEVPDALGWSEPAWWYVVLVPALAGVLVAAAIRLPGHGGHVPLVRSTAFPDVLSAASSMRSNATALMSTPGLKAMTSPPSARGRGRRARNGRGTHATLAARRHGSLA